MQYTPQNDPEQNIQAVAERFYHAFKTEITLPRFYVSIKFMQSNPECEVDPIQKTGRFDCHRGK